MNLPIAIRDRRGERRTSARIRRLYDVFIDLARQVSLIIRQVGRLIVKIKEDAPPEGVNASDHVAPEESHDEYIPRVSNYAYDIYLRL